MIVYLDNSQNRAKAPNENLSRELLELFTLGVGNYTEQDIKDGARALAGLNIGDEGGQYYPRMMDTSDKTYLGKKGNWKADDLVEIIFKHPKAGYLLSEKLLKWFVSDTPSVSMVNEYAEFFRKQDFEIKPILKKLISDKRFLESQGEKIKDPTSFVLQLHQEFQLDLPPMRFLMPYFTEQGMKLLNPPNVKGWDGGKAWLSSQKLIQRVGLVSILASGKNLEKGKLKGQKRQDEALDIIDIDEEIIMGKFSDKMPSINWDKTLKTNKDIINNMTDRLIFATNADLQKDMEQILKYDFNPNQPNAQQAINRLAEYIMKTPEFQIC